MKRAILIAWALLACCAAPQGAAAQITHTPQGGVDRKAQALLAKAEKAMNAGPLAFSVTMETRDAHKNTTSKHTAQVLYDKGRYRLEMGGRKVLCDGTAVFAISDDAKEVTISAMSQQEDDLSNPGALLAHWKKNFRAKYIRTERSGTAVVDLVPLKGKSYHKIRMMLSPTGMPKEMTMHNYDGSEARFALGGARAAKAVAADFVFDRAAHPGYEVIDMR